MDPPWTMNFKLYETDILGHFHIWCLKSLCHNKSLKMVIGNMLLSNITYEFFNAAVCKKSIKILQT